MISRARKRARSNRASAPVASTLSASVPEGSIGADFVGRRAELQSLARLLDTARRGRAVATALVGEAGIGKTCTARELVASLSPSPGVTVLWGRCHEAEGAPDYWAWARVIEGVALGLEGNARRGLLEHTGPEIALVAPTLAPYFDKTPPPVVRPSRYWVFESVVRFLRRAAEREPLLIVFDDLHWADPSTISLLEHVIVSLTSSPIMTVCAYRHPPIPPSRALSRLHATLQKAGQCIELKGLSSAELGELLSHSLDEPADDALVVEVLELTEGNPFLIAECLPVLRTGGAVARQIRHSGRPFRFPVGSALAHRMAFLTPEQRRLLESAAVIGRDFDLTLLGELAGLTRAELVATLEGAVAAGLLLTTPSQDVFRFSHALLREALYEDLRVGERAELHRAIAAAIEGLHSKHLPPMYSLLSRHYLAAAMTMSAQPAVDYSIRAAEHSWQRGAFEAAAAGYERALQAQSLLPPDPQTRCKLLFHLGRAHGLGGDAVRAVEVLRQAVELAADRKDTTTVAEAALEIGRIVDETGIFEPTTAALIESALEGLGEADHPLRARLLGRLAQAIYFGRDRQRCDALSRSGVDMARRLGDAETLVETLLYRHFVLWGPGTAARRRAIVEEVLDLTSDIEPQLLALSWSVVDLMELGDLPAVEKAIDRLASTVLRARLPRFEWQLALIRGGIALLRGDLAEAERLNHRATSFWKGGGVANAGPFAMAQRYFLRREQGRLRELKPTLQQAVEQPGAPPIWRSGLALLYVELGEMVAARAELDAIAAGSPSALPRDGTWLPTLALLSEVIFALRETDLAQELYALLRPVADVHVVVATGAAFLGSTERYLALLADVLQLEKARAHYEAALATNTKLAGRPLVARVQIEYAGFLLRSPHPADGERAHALIADAEHTGEHLGLAAIRAAALRVRRQVPRPATPPPHLASFERVEHGWRVSYEAQTVSLSDRKGAGYICELLRRPGQQIHVMDLIGYAEGQALPLEARIEGPPRLDTRARDDYRRHLAALQEDLAEAEAHNDIGRIARIRAEIDAVTRELSRGVGLGGRPRRESSQVERARLNVTRAIRSVVRQLSSIHKRLGHHLETHISTGKFCTYRPNLDHPVHWEV